LFKLWTRSVIGTDEIWNAAAVRNEWLSPGFDPAEDICLVFAPDGTLAGYIEVWTTAKPPVHPMLWGRGHPDYNGLGIGTWMLTWAENHPKALDELVGTALCAASRHPPAGSGFAEIVRGFGLPAIPQQLRDADCA
jgi:GNAT superfamily N-acetyltransferase